MGKDEPCFSRAQALLWLSLCSLWLCFLPQMGWGGGVPEGRAGSLSDWGSLGRGCVSSETGVL